MTKITYVNMGVKSSVRTSTIQPAAPKLSKVHFNILNLKNKIWSDFLCIFWNFLCIFDVIFSSTKILKIIFLTTVKMESLAMYMVVITLVLGTGRFGVLEHNFENDIFDN